MINKIKYNAHLIIHSKYKLLIHLFVLSLIYLSLYNQKIAFCMMEDNSGYDINTQPIIEDSTAKKKLSLEEIVRERLATRRRADLGTFYINTDPDPIPNDISDEDLYIHRHSCDPRIAELIKERDLIFPQEFNMKPLKSYLDPEEYILKTSLSLREQMFAAENETFVNTGVESKATEVIKRNK